ncbi:hypothetical protein ABEB36_015334 [Hypothenemus hampei]|uniref:Uncharacterized protein n=1 Tax=Hypothenemus hampei TaxID=57062 RepID=A0ABD1E0T6_HYPHA
MEHNPQNTSSDRRRKYLKNLANELCLPAIITRSNIPKVIGNHFTKSSIKLALGRQVTIHLNTSNKDEVSRDASGRIACVGYCHVCRENKEKLENHAIIAQNPLVMNILEQCVPVVVIQEISFFIIFFV